MTAVKDSRRCTVLTRKGTHCKHRVWRHSTLYCWAHRSGMYLDKQLTDMSVGYNDIFFVHSASASVLEGNVQ